MHIALISVAPPYRGGISKHTSILAENISKIKEAVYDPDNGLYARLSSLGSRLDALETWKNNNTKILWIVVAAVVGLMAKTMWATLF